jgi:hypothetical protein
MQELLEKWGREVGNDKNSRKKARVSRIDRFLDIAGTCPTKHDDSLSQRK